MKPGKKSIEIWLKSVLVAAYALGPMGAANASSIPSTITPPTNAAGEIRNGYDFEEPLQVVNDAVPLIEAMKRDQRLSALLSRARGLFIIPDAKGMSRGILVVNEHGLWSDPAFYDCRLPRLSGKDEGDVQAAVFLLMDRRTIDAFKSKNRLSFNVGARWIVPIYRDIQGAADPRSAAVAVILHAAVRENNGVNGDRLGC